MQSRQRDPIPKISSTPFAQPLAVLDEELNVISASRWEVPTRQRR
jgi:hypothetical protein